MNCEWVIQKPDKEKVQELVEKHGISSLLATILVNNSITDDDVVEEYLYPEKNDYHDPFLLNDMEKLISTLLKIRENGEKIAIYGDYDVDGVTSTGLVYSILKRLGWDVEYYIPTRLEEGYGVSKVAIMELFNKSIKNILTVDCGITSFEEVAYANFLKFKVMITDHHDVQDKIPEAEAVVNPKRPDDHYPFKGLAGVGVAFKVMDALLTKLGNPIELNEYLDLVTLGTVADIVPLLGENRLIVRRGIPYLAKTKRVGLKKLMKISGIELEHLQTHDIGFKIAPKLNAVGRLSSAETALRLLITEDPAEANKLANHLMNQNHKRQSIENSIYLEAEKMIQQNPDIAEAPVLVLAKKGWHPGVIGIVSSRLTAKYYKPTLMISIDEENIGRGSARSIEQVNIMDLFSSVADNFEEFGGHPMAAGFTISADNIDRLREDLAYSFYKYYGSDAFNSKIFIDAEVSIPEISDAMLNILDKLKPFGQSNHEPVFLLKNLSIEKLKLMGSRMQHMRMILKKGRHFVDSIAFNQAKKIEEFRYIRPNLLRCDVVGNLKTIWHYGTKQNQIFVKDINFFIDPSFKEEEDDKSFVFGLIEDWEKQDLTHRKQDLAVLKKELTHKLFSKYPSFSEKIYQEEPTGIFASLLVQELILLLKIINAIERGEKTLVITPSKLFQKHRINSIRRFSSITTQFLTDETNDLNAACIFTTITEFLKNHERLNSIENRIFLDMEHLFNQSLIEKEMVEDLTKAVKKDTNKNLTVLGGEISKDKKDLIKQYFGIERLIIEHSKRHKRGLVDRRDNKNPVKYISQLVHNGDFVAVFVQSNEKTIELTRVLGNSLSDYFRNGEVVFYNSTLKSFQRTRIEELISVSKVKLFITTYEIGGTIQFPKNANICLLEPPKTPLDVLSISNPVDRRKATPIFHLLFDRIAATERKRETFDILPSKSDIIPMVKLGCSNGLNKVEDLKNKGKKLNLLHEDKWFLIKEVLNDIGMTDNQEIIDKDENRLIKKLKLSLKMEENCIDRKIIENYIDYFIQKSGRRVLTLIDHPTLPLSG